MSHVDGCIAKISATRGCGFCRQMQSPSTRLPVSPNPWFSPPEPVCPPMDQLFTIVGASIFHDVLGICDDQDPTSISAVLTQLFKGLESRWWNHLRGILEEEMSVPTCLSQESVARDTSGAIRPDRHLSVQSDSARKLHPGDARAGCWPRFRAEADLPDARRLQGPRAQRRSNGACEHSKITSAEL